MRVDLDLKRLDSFGRRLDSTIDRITIGLMTASLVIGSSIVMTVQAGPSLYGLRLLTVLGLLGYLMAFYNSLWIIVSIWRSRRDELGAAGKPGPRLLPGRAKDPEIVS